MEGQGYCINPLHQTPSILPYNTAIHPWIQDVSSYVRASPGSFQNQTPHSAMPVHVVNPDAITHYLPHTSQVITQNAVGFVTSTPQVLSNVSPLKIWCIQNRTDGGIQRCNVVHQKVMNTVPVANHSYFEGLMSDNGTPSKNMSVFSDLNSSSSTLSIDHPSLDITPSSMFAGTPQSTIAWSCEKQTSASTSIRCYTGNISTENLLHNKSAKKQLFTSTAAASTAVESKNVFDIFKQELKISTQITDSDCFIISSDTEKRHLTSTPVQNKFNSSTVSKTPVKCKEGSVSVDMKVPTISSPGTKIEIKVTPVARPSIAKSLWLSISNSGCLLPDDCIDLTNDIKEEDILGSSRRNQSISEKHDVSVQVDLIKEYHANNQCSAIQDHNYQFSSDMDSKSLSMGQKDVDTNVNNVKASAYRSSNEKSISDVNESSFSPRTCKDTILNTRRYHCCNDSDSTIEYTTGYHSNSAAESISPWPESSFSKKINVCSVREGVQTEKTCKNSVILDLRSASCLTDVKVHVDQSKVMSRHFVPISTCATTPTKNAWSVVKPAVSRSFSSLDQDIKGADNDTSDASVQASSLLQLSANPIIHAGSNCSDSPLDITSTCVTDKASDKSLLKDTESGLPCTPSTESSAAKKQKQSGDKALEKLLDEAVGINGMKKRKTPRCLKCHRWFRSDSLLAEHYQFHDIIRTRSGHLTLYGSSHHVHRHSSNSNSPTSSGTECITCTPPVGVRKKRRHSCSTPVSRFESLRNGPYNLHYTPSTSTDSEKLNSGCKRRKINFKKPGRPKKTNERNGEFEPSSSTSEISRVLRLRKRNIEVIEAQKNDGSSVKTPVNLRSSAKKVQKPSKSNKVKLKHISLIKKKISKLPVRYIAKLSPKFISKGLQSKKLFPTTKFTPSKKKIFKAKAVFSKIPVPLRKKANQVKNEKSLQQLSLGLKKTKQQCNKYESKQTLKSINNKNAQYEQLPKTINNKKKNDVRQSIDKTVTIKHRGYKTATEEVIRPIVKKTSCSDMYDSTTDQVHDKLPTDKNKPYSLRKATIAQGVKALSKQQIKTVLNCKDVNCKVNKVSECKRTIVTTKQNSKNLEYVNDKLCSKINDKRPKKTAVRSKMCKKSVDCSFKIEEPSVNNKNEPADDCGQSFSQSKIMPVVDKSFVKENEDLDFEAALLEMKLVNDGLPPFVVDNKYMHNLKLKTHGKNLDTPGSYKNKLVPKKNKSVHSKKAKSFMTGNSKDTTSCKRTSSETTVQTSGSVILSTNKNNSSDKSLPEKFKLVWKTKERQGDSHDVKHSQSKSSTETICVSNIQTGKVLGKKQHDPLAYVKCKYCDAVMPRKDLPGHRLLQHRYICNICKNRFATKEQQLAHLKTHTVFHECQLCERKFTNISSFKRHLSSQDHLRLEKVQRHTMDYMYQKLMREKAPQQQNALDQQSHLGASSAITATCQPVDSAAATASGENACFDFTINDGFLNELGINDPDQCETEISNLPVELSPAETEIYPPVNIYPSDICENNISDPGEFNHAQISDQMFDSGLGSSGEPSFNMSSGIRTALNLVDLFVGDDFVSF